MFNLLIPLIYLDFLSFVQSFSEFLDGFSILDFQFIYVHFFF